MYNWRNELGQTPIPAVKLDYSWDTSFVRVNLLALFPGCSEVSKSNMTLVVKKLKDCNKTCKNPVIAPWPVSCFGLEEKDFSDDY